MTYYIMMPGDTEKDMANSSNILGEESFGTFYSEQGMVALNNIINKHPEFLDKIKIFNEQRKELTLTEFFDIIGELKIRKQ